MPLLLRPEDLSGGDRPGATLWQRKRTPVSPGELVLAWEDLVLVRPNVRFPEDCDYRSEPGWQDGVRVVWSPKQVRWHFLAGVPVRDLRPVENLGPSAGRALAPREVRERLSPGNAERAAAAAGGGVRFRLVEFGGFPLVLGWKGDPARLRVVAAGFEATQKKEAP